MRVIAGSLGGRNFSSPRTHRTHPMSDKVRGALFNMLGDLNNLSMLDAYAGSGACSIEAVSRGAKHVLAIDIDRDAVKTITENVRLLGLGSDIAIKQANINGWLRNQPAEQFDIVLADPPYDAIKPDTLRQLATLVRSDGVFAISWPGGEPVQEFAGFTVVGHKAYGDAELIFYRRT
ncbi:MAG TPA: RsmD family RNA methyltransferase [Verrucomicrobiae bacterium]|nr:RsmD family RNA methyltransferase [Verrucomicrobiae bacterium]